MTAAETVYREVLMKPGLKTGIRVLCPLLLCACSSYEGRYAPQCVALAGDTVELRDGRIRWDKFTDQVRIDEDGNVIDQFPDFPVESGYRIEAGRIVLEDVTSLIPNDLMLLREGGKTYMLTGVQFQTWKVSGEVPHCALGLRKE